MGGAMGRGTERPSVRRALTPGIRLRAANRAAARTHRAGFTLIELLISIAIIGVLIALLLPAIQAAREAARMTQCRNNLKQIATSFHSFESSRRYFPGHGGEREPRNVVISQEQLAAVRTYPVSGNWMLQSLKFMERRTLADVLIAATQLKGDRTRMMAAVATPVATFYCPSRRAVAAYPLIKEELQAFGRLGARTDYAISGGSADSEGNDRRFVKHGRDGIWTIGRRVAPKHVEDGLSNTYLVGEKAMDVLQYTTGEDIGDRAPLAGLASHPGATNSYVRFAAVPPSADAPNNCQSCHNFGSSHVAAWNMSMADGSVHAYSYEIDIKLHQALATINAGDAASPP